MPKEYRPKHWFNRSLNVIKAIDRFGKEPMLLYDSDQFKTYFGGLVTIIAFGALFAYTLYLLVVTFDRKNANLHSSSYVEEINAAQRIHNPAQHGFKFAFTIKYDDYQHYKVLNDSRFIIRAQEAHVVAPEDPNDFIFQFNLKDLEIGSCEDNPTMRAELMKRNKLPSNYI